MNVFLTFDKLVYFYFAPTFCFQLVYPRTKQTNWPWLFRKIIELIILWIIMNYLLVQCVYPILSESQFILLNKNLKVWDIVEYVG